MYNEEPRGKLRGMAPAFQSSLPFGSVEDVRREVRERISVMCRGGGYIIAPSHAIQGGTLPQNIAAFWKKPDGLS